ncbi:MAG: OmpW family outer membrane protein [Pseudomonadales bacterium]|nr:OmpW family outer membrane protein [Pseudomonadales bacterium]
MQSRHRATLFNTFFLGLIASLPASVAAQQQGDWIIRAGAATVEPKESSRALNTVAVGPLAATGVGVDPDTQLGLNLVYMLSDNIAIELLASTPFEHDLAVQGLGGFGFSTTRLGSGKHLPPTVTALYYFGQPAKRFRPYVGAGLNYTLFFEESLSSQARNELGANSLKLDDSVGWSVSAGFDYKLDQNWLINAAVRRINIETDASLGSALGRITTRVDIDPWVYMISLGYIF